MSVWYCEGCVKDKSDHDIPCPKCCGWHMLPSDAQATAATR